MKDKSEANLWSMFSKFIRARDANYQGYCKCISCSTVKKWSAFDAGHYIPKGSDSALKYNEMNVNAQCTSCNQYKSGNLIQYRFGLVDKYGKKEVEALELAHRIKTIKKKPNQLEINELYKYYKEEFEKLQKSKCLI